MLVFVPGDKVFAKMKGYPAWPAKILSVVNETSNKRRYNVFFYGTNQTAVVKGENIYSFQENKSKYGKPKKHKSFAEALKEIEADSDTEEGDNSSTEGEEPATKTTDKESKERENNSVNNISNKPSTSRLPQPKTLKHKIEHDEEHPGKKKKKKKYEISTTSESSRDSSPDVIYVKEIQPERIASSSDDDTYDSDEITIVSDEISERRKKHLSEPGYYITATNKGNEVRIPIKLNRPEFDDERKLKIWDEMVLAYAKSLKTRIEDGEIVRDIYNIMNEWTTAKAVEFINDSKSESQLKSLAFLQVEAHLLDIDISIKRALSLDEAYTHRCIELLDELDGLTIDPLMLKKQPEVLLTIKRMRNYVGNIGSWDMEDEEMQEFRRAAARIRTKSGKLYAKFKSLFQKEDAINFWKYFNDEVRRFKEKTTGLSLAEVMSLVEEP